MKLSLAKIMKEYHAEIEERKTTPLQKKRYSFAFKAKVVQFILEGGNKTETTQTLSITRSALYSWVKKFSNENHSLFKELTVIDNFKETKNYFTIETPSGFKIKLDSQQKLVSIIRALEMAP